MAWETMPPDFRALAERVCTPRELDVLRLRAQGMGTWRIAAVLGISGYTVKNLRRNADMKMQWASLESVETT